MPSPADTLLFSPGATFTALKWSGGSITVGDLVAATTVRVIAGGGGVVCAATEAGRAIATSSRIPLVLNCMPASQFKGSSNHHTLSRRHLEWPTFLNGHWTRRSFGSKRVLN